MILCIWRWPWRGDRSATSLVLPPAPPAERRACLQCVWPNTVWLLGFCRDASGLNACVASTGSIGTSVRTGKFGTSPVWALIFHRGGKGGRYSVTDILNQSCFLGYYFENVSRRRSGASINKISLIPSALVRCRPGRFFTSECLAGTFQKAVSRWTFQD